MSIGQWLLLCLYIFSLSTAIAAVATGDREVSGICLIGMAIIVAHDAYGNRLLPGPNWMAQLAGYSLALLLLMLGLSFLGRP